MDKKKLRFAILKEIDTGNKELSEAQFGVDEETFDDAVNFLKSEEYISGVMYADNRPYAFGSTVYLTEKGETYLAENNAWAKAYKGLKEIRDWLKL
ncbi:hypothetical protein NCCP2222_01990 [Sporosarcina sp. NCCP-2222]|uniref:YjcQ family protein n=1 Tax=Sporosarcina sp. NCCP-2222 TaxID=2935073 RepID=UPI00207E4E32|nr:YjcQ family protein [Sporosarcina sp. NCCP-2222]GKV54252.1 hypothetical protein NCCP2222_01990 [Sporosarcina sp. NCCP-2222]